MKREEGGGKMDDRRIEIERVIRIKDHDE